MKYTLMLLAVVLFACNSQPEKEVVEQSIDPKLLITCEGIGDVKLSDTYADLQKKFGDSVLSQHENNKAGKFTTLWENKPEQINIYWKESAAPFKTIRYMELTDKMSTYMTKDSIHIGTSLRDLVKKNAGMAITFRNFHADNQPGVITGYNNGDLPKINPCFEGTLESTGQDPIDSKEFAAFKAQEEVKSFDRILNRIDVELSTIRVSAKK